jgi:hypothetical protein
VVSRSRALVEHVDANREHTPVRSLSGLRKTVDAANEALMLVRRSTSHVQNAFPHLVETVDSAAPAIGQLFVGGTKHEGPHHA